MSDKFFDVNKPDTVVTIISEQANFYQLSDGNMIKKDSFMSKYQPILPGFENELNESKTQVPNRQYVDELDPSNFFSKPSVSMDIVNKISSVDTSKVSDHRPEPQVRKIDNSGNVQQSQPTQQIFNESLVTEVKNQPIPNNTETDVSMYKVYENDDDAYVDPKLQNTVVQNNQVQQNPIDTKQQEIELLYMDEVLMFGKDEAELRKSKRLGREQKTQQPNNIIQQPMQQPNDPITMMFSTFKRNHEITINVEFKDKIGKPDFIKMMIENMEGDIVGYYKKLIMDNIKKDLSKIEDIVEKELRLQIYGEVKKVDDILEVVDMISEPGWSVAHTNDVEAVLTKKKTKINKKIK